MPKRRFFPLCALLFFALAGASCERAQAEASKSEFVLGTICTVTLYDQARDSVYRDIFARLRAIENRMSVNIAGSDVAKINAQAGVGAVRVHEDVFAVIERALRFAELSGGAFDPSIGPLVSLWAIGTDHARLPAPEEIGAALPLVNWRDVVLDSGARSVFLTKAGMKLDLGGIAKGYAADEAAAIIRAARLKRAIIDLGGNILTLGEKADKTLWRVGVQNPLDTRGAYIGVVRLREKTVVTSGVYERYFEQDGAHYHHIFSSADGYPARSGLLSVTIIADSSMDADALSTAAFVLGAEKGGALIESLAGVEAVFIFEDKSVKTTSGLDFALTDESFTPASG